MATTELPVAWKKPDVADEPAWVELPECDTSDPAQLAAFYGNFGWGDHLRKIVLSNCREVVRARMAAADMKVSEARLDDLARTHPVYTAWVVKNLPGRVAYEQDVLARGLGG